MGRSTLPESKSRATLGSDGSVSVKGTKGYQRVPKGTKGYQRVPKGTKGYQRVPKGTKGYQRVPKGTSVKMGELRFFKLICGFVGGYQGSKASHNCPQGRSRSFGRALLFPGGIRCGRW